MIRTRCAGLVGMMIPARLCGCRQGVGLPQRPPRA